MIRLFVAAVLGLFATLGGAQSYPVKPVRMIIPYPPGGGTDFFARTLGAKLSESLGQPLVMEQRPGAGGVIGADVAAKAAPDGYTLLIGQASNLAINQHLMGKLPYDPVRDFSPVTLIGGSPNLLVVHPSLPVRTVKDLVALARAKPGAINYASAGNGSPGHLAAEYFKRTAKIDLVHVPYKGANPALMDVLAGHASLYFTSPVSAQALVQSGRLRQIAVTSAKRFPPLPDVPTIAESGYPGYEVIAWFGLLVPAATPADLVNRANADTAAALKSADVRQRMANEGMEPVGNSPREFGAFLASELKKWGRVVAEAGVKLEN